MMKKILIGGLLMLGLFTVTNYVQANDDGCANGGVYSSVTGQLCSATQDITPRIMYWWGKVNQHTDGQGNWQSDSDGTSGANLDKLAYCKKFYPNTTSVSSYKSETINTWRRAALYEQSGYTATVISDKCEQGTIDTNPYITLLYPKSGDTFTSGENINVSWSTNASPSTYVYASVLDNSSNLIREVRTPNDGQETIKIPAGTPAGQYKIYYQIVFGPNASGYHMTDFVIINVVSPVIVGTGDTTPRIAYWWGKVNQHIDSQGNWQSDPDGTSGANLDKLAYCQKWYPKTTSVTPYQSENINTWRRNIMYEQSGYVANVISDKCVQGSVVTTRSITVTSPNGGEVFNQGQSNSITWVNGSGITQIGLVSADSAMANPNVLGWIKTDVLPGSQNISWDGNGVTDLAHTVTWPVAPGRYKIIAVGSSLDGVGNYCMGTSGIYNQCNFDISNEPFTIYSTPQLPTCNVTSDHLLTVISPNGGEVYQPGQNITIKWSCSHAPAGQKIGITLEHLQNNGTTQAPPDANGSPVTTLVNDVNGQVLVSAGSADVTLPNFNHTIGSNYYRVVIYWWNTNTATGENDMSDSYFKIVTSGKKDETTLDSGMSSHTSKPMQMPTRTLKIGMKGDDVKFIQKSLGLKVDGSYGQFTALKVKEWQSAHGVKADGSFGPASRAKLNLNN